MENGAILNGIPDFVNGKTDTLTPLASTTEPDGTACLGRLGEPIVDDGVVDYLDIISNVISIVLRIVSIGLNITLAAEYYHKGAWNQFVWTTCCIIGPMIITMLLCTHMHYNDRKRTSKKGIGIFLWMVVLCPFLFRYYKSLKYAIYSMRAQKRNDLVKQKQYYKYMLEEEADVALIRVFESSLEAAPQKVLQISIYLAGVEKMTWLQFLAICGCFGSLTWGIVVYYKYNRVTRPEKEKISWIGIFFQILWHFCIYTSRILCVAVVASIFPIGTITACIVHAIVMCLVTLLIERPIFCSNTIFHRIAFSLTIGAVFIFTYISLKDVRTRLRYTLYYTLCAIENLICVYLFWQCAPDAFKRSDFFLPLCLVSLISFYVGIVFMIIYYTYFHPNVMARRSLSVQSVKNLE